MHIEEDSVLELWQDQAPAPLWDDPGMPHDPEDIFPELAASNSSLGDGSWIGTEADSRAEDPGLSTGNMHAQPGTVPREAGASGNEWQHAHPSYAAIAQAAAEQLGSASTAGR